MTEWWKNREGTPAWLQDIHVVGLGLRRAGGHGRTGPELWPDPGLSPHHSSSLGFGQGVGGVGRGQACKYSCWTPGEVQAWVEGESWGLAVGIWGEASESHQLEEHRMFCVDATQAMWPLFELKADYRRTWTVFSRISDKQQ